MRLILSLPVLPEPLPFYLMARQQTRDYVRAMLAAGTDQERQQIGQRFRKRRVAPAIQRIEADPALLEIILYDRRPATTVAAELNLSVHLLRRIRQLHAPLIIYSLGPASEPRPK